MKTTQNVNAPALLGFGFKGNPVTTVVEDGVPYFRAKEIAQALGYKDTDQAIRIHVESESQTRIQDGTNPKAVVYLNESGVYDLILSSKKAEAKAFKRWLTQQVIPSIRQRGLYVQGQAINPRLMDALAKNIHENVMPALRMYDRLTEHDHFTYFKNPAKARQLHEDAINHVALRFDLPRSLVEELANTGLSCLD